MFGGALGEGSVEVGVRVRGWREAVEVCGRLLVRSGAADEGYVAAMVRVVEELGPYAVIAPGVVLPHARPEDGAREVGLSLAVLVEPVWFGPRAGAVDLLFGFAAPHGDAHVERLGELADFAEREENLRALRRARDAREVLRIVERGRSA